MTPPGEILAEEGELRLVRKDRQHAALWHGETPLLILPRAPSWHCPSPLRVARLALDAMPPAAPRFIPDRIGRGLVGGLYVANDDTILLFHRDKLHESEIAQTIIHECAHATGHPTRLRRPCFHGVTEPTAAIDHESYALAGTEPEAGSEDMQEEIVASLATALVCPRLGLDLCASSHWFIWLPRAATLPLERLTVAIAEAQAAAAFILNE